MALFEDDPKWNGPVRILPSEFFISVGPGKQEGKFYPTMMKPRLNGEALNYLGGTEEYMIVGQLKFGFDTINEALDFAAKMMTAVPILKDDMYQWPYFVEESEAIKRIKQQAVDRRIIRQTKMRQQFGSKKNGHDVA